MTKGKGLVGIAVVLSAWALVWAQPQTLDLSFEGDLYLSHVSEGLDGLGSYRQESVVVRVQPNAEGGSDELRQVESRVVAANGDSSSFSSNDVMPGFSIAGSQHHVSGRNFVVNHAGETPTCNEAPALQPLGPLETGVADLTGFREATLAAAGETVNRLLADRYDLVHAQDITSFSDLRGELWVASDGGFIVRYSIEGVTPSGVRTHWTYDLLDVGATPTVELPEVCPAL